jgi:methylenetetrahydrofolate--tRNA-(uracil-5-)-methyltransferase
MQYYGPFSLPVPILPAGWYNRKMKVTEAIWIVGGGLAGCEAAWQAAERGIPVRLSEMRPGKETGAHASGDLAELVCSNSLGSNLVDRASGLLKEELRRLGSLLLDCAAETALPAGGALAVDREAFARLVTARVEAHPRIKVVREEVRSIPPGPAVIASGPLTSPELARAIQDLTGHEALFFYDAIAPIVRGETIDMRIAFRASRYGTGEQEEGDYVNCPFSRAEYERFHAALLQAERIPLRWFEQEIEQGVTAGAKGYFEGCLPVEVLAARGLEALAFGPLRPVGLKDPRSGRRPYAVAQLRQDNLAGTLYNLVGFQTNLTYAEQKRVLRLVPGLESAEFVRYGQMHRNTFIAAPLALRPTLQLGRRADLFFAGQITGVEGYMGNIATGLLAGLNAARLLQGLQPVAPPPTTMLGGLLHYITEARLEDFQPMKANFGILPLLAGPGRGRRERAGQYARRALEELENWAAGQGLALREGLWPAEIGL